MLRRISITSLACKLSIVVAASCSLAGCNSRQPVEGQTTVAKTVQRSEPEHELTIGASIAEGVAQPVAAAIANVLDKHEDDTGLSFESQTIVGAKEYLDMLERGELQFAVSHAPTTWDAVRPDDVHDDVRVVATLSPNVGVFLTKVSSGIRSISDLKGRRVAIGPEEAGFQTFLEPLLKAHGVAFDELEPQYLDTRQSIEQLGDGQCDAAFIVGPIPNSAVTLACNKHNLVFLPYDPAARKSLLEEYPFYNPVTIPAVDGQGRPTYRGMLSDFSALNVGSMQLITHADIEEEVVYQVTKALWQLREKVAEANAAGHAINESNAPRDTGAPFHEGAIRFYREIGIWRDDQPAEEPSDEEPADDGKTGIKEDAQASETAAESGAESGAESAAKQPQAP